MVQDLEFKNSFNDTLFGHKWITENEKAILLLVTGMAEHSLRYDHFANFLNENNISVYCIDHYGQGKNGVLGQPGENYFFKMEQTIKEMILKLQEENPNKEIYLFAHSMGSFVTQGFIQEFGGIVNKICLCGSNGNTILFKLGSFLASIITTKKNYNKKANLLYKLSIGAYEKAVDGNDKNAWISVNEGNVKRYNEDPLSGFECSNGFYYEFMKGLASLHNKKKMKNIKKDLQILIVGGVGDPVGNFGKGLKKLQQEYKKYGVNAQLILYENMRHEILNEEENLKVYNDILNFYKKSG